MRCDGIVVDYRFNGQWKHGIHVIKSANGIADPSLISDDELLNWLVLSDRNHEYSLDNIVCFGRVLNWNRSLAEFEKAIDNQDVEAFRGLAMMHCIVNEDLYKEWSRPERVN